MLGRDRPHAWLNTWRDSYLRLLGDYKIRTVTKIEKIRVMHWVNIGKADEYHFEFWYQMAEDRLARIIYRLHEDCIIYVDHDVAVDADDTLDSLIEFSSNAQYSRTKKDVDKCKRYATLFYRKTEDYFKKANRAMAGDAIATKVIRMTSDSLNPKEQMLLNRSVLESRELDDLLK